MPNGKKYMKTVKIGRGFDYLRKRETRNKFDRKEAKIPFGIEGDKLGMKLLA